jgi:hypothetical protein
VYKQCTSICQPESGQGWTSLKRNTMFTKTAEKPKRPDFCAAINFV